MVASEDPLPRFRNPPVEEVSLGVHFRPVSALGILQVAELARLWASSYPDVREVPEMPPAPESVMGDGFGQVGIQVEMLDRPPLPRIWFLSSGGTLIRQVQRDRLVQNWRRTKSSDDYPHYDQLLPKFETAYHDLETVLGGTPESAVCEVSYTNPVRLTPIFKQVGEVQKVIAPWSGGFSDSFLPQAEQVTVAARFPIVGSDGMRLGQLDVTGHPAFHAPTAEHLLLLQLVARGKPTQGGLEGVLQFFDVAHEWIVRGFKSFTTEGMHREWEIQ